MTPNPIVFHTPNMNETQEEWTNSSSSFLHQIPWTTNSSLSNDNILDTSGLNWTTNDQFQWILLNSTYTSSLSLPTQTRSTTLHPNWTSTHRPSTDHWPVVTSSSDFSWWILFLTVFIFAGGLGNVLVCLAICLDRRLQNMTNYFLLSLAVADLLVSLVVMPFGVVNSFTGYWPFGSAMCNVYITSDVLACSSSIMHMCFISVGRYMGIRNPLKTRVHSKKAVVFKIVLVWLLSMVITSPITLLGLDNRTNIVPREGICAINNKFFFIFGSLFAFYIPMVFMVVAYVLTVQLLRQQAKLGDKIQVRRLHLRGRQRGGGGREGRSKFCSSTSSTSSSSLYTSQWAAAQSYRTADSGGESGTGSTNNGHAIYGGRALVCDQSTQTPTQSQFRASGQQDRPARFQLTKSASTVHFKFLPQRLSRQNRSIRENNAGTVANEQKASKVLGLVFFTFVVCWAPFFILNLIFAACPSCPVSDRIVNTCLWLGYVSSTINPIIYTIFNRTFKEAFVRLLTCQCTRRRRRRWGPGFDDVSSGLLRRRHYSASEGLAQGPIKIIGCLRSPTFPPPTSPTYDHRSMAVSEC